MYADSASYRSVANDILHFSMPDTLIRTPVYPFFILPFLVNNNLKLLVVTQLLLSSFNILLLYSISNKILRNQLMSFILAFICVFDYNQLQFQYIMLAECLAGFLLLLFFHTLLDLIPISNLLKTKFLFKFIFVSLLLIFVKPVFVFLPFVVAFMILLVIPLISRSTAYLKPRLKFLLIQMFICLVFVIAWCGLNYYRYGIFTMTRLSQVNLLSKTIQYGYLARYQPFRGDPEIIRKSSNFVKNNPGDANPFKLIFYLNQDVKIHDNLDNISNINEVSNFFIKRNLVDFIRRTTFLSIENLLNEREIYIKINDRYLISQLYSAVLKYKGKFAFLILLNFIWIYYFLKTKKYLELLNFGLLFITVFYILFLNSLTWFEYSRLMAPAELLINLLMLLPVFLIPGYFLKKS